MSERERQVAEQGRVEAEHARQRSMRRVYARVAALIALPLALIALIPSMVGLVFLHHQNQRLEQQNHRLEQEIRDRCQEGRVNRDAIRSTVTDGLPALGYRFDQETGRIVRYGAPIDYYATHPEELEDALARASAALERFPQIRCQ